MPYSNRDIVVLTLDHTKVSQALACWLCPGPLAVILLHLGLFVVSVVSPGVMQFKCPECGSLSALNLKMALSSIITVSIIMHPGRQIVRCQAAKYK